MASVYMDTRKSESTTAKEDAAPFANIDFTELASLETRETSQRLFAAPESEEGECLMPEDLPQPASEDPPNKKSRSEQRSVFIDQADTGRANSVSRRRFHKRRAPSKSPYHQTLKHLLPLCKPEAVASILAVACQQHQPTADAVKALLAKEPACKCVLVKNLPYGCTASEVSALLQANFGPVAACVVVTKKGWAAVEFAALAGAVASVCGRTVDDRLLSPRPIQGVSLHGRPLVCRFAGPGDTFSDLFAATEGVDFWPPNAQSCVHTAVARQNRKPEKPARVRRPEHLLVSNLIPAIDEAALAAAFAHFGDLRRVSISKKNPSRGYVSFVKSEDALRAAQQTQRLIAGRMVFISLVGSRV